MRILKNLMENKKKAYLRYLTTRSETIVDVRRLKVNNSGRTGNNYDGIKVRKFSGSDGINNELTKHAPQFF